MHCTPCVALETEGKKNLHFFFFNSYKNKIKIALRSSWEKALTFFKSSSMLEVQSVVHLFSSGSTMEIEVLVTYLEKEMATHSNVLAWRIPGTGEPGGLPSMESHRVKHDWATLLSRFTFMHWRRKWQPTPMFLPGKSHEQRNLVGYSYRVTKSWTWLSD